MREHMEILAAPIVDPDLTKFPSIEIESIQATVSLSDRMHADEAFNRPFTESVREAMTWYLKQRGLHTVDHGGDLRCTGSIDSYEGWRGWGHWGVDLHMTLKFFRGTQLVLTDDLHSFLKYRSDNDVRDEERPKYRARDLDVEFSEILFTRIGVDLSEKLIALLKEKAGTLATFGDEQAQAAVGSPGRLSVDATTPNAEVLVDGQLVGTTPVVELILPVRTHALEIRKHGFKPWIREVSILSGATSRIVADLEKE